MSQNFVELECSCVKASDATCAGGGELTAYMTVDQNLGMTIEAEGTLTSPGADELCNKTVDTVFGSGPFYTVGLDNCECEHLDETWVVEIEADGETYTYSILSIDGCSLDLQYKSSTDNQDRQILVGDSIRLSGKGPETGPNLVLGKDLEATIEGLGELDSRLTAFFGFDVTVVGESEIQEGFTVDYALSQRITGSGDLNVVETDMIAGEFGDFYCLEKLYPKSDLPLDAGFGPFSGPSGDSSDIFEYIDEGVYQGILEDRGDSVTLADEGTFIAPDSIHTEGFFQYKCELTDLTVRPEHTAFRMRAAAPLETYEAKIPPLYTVYNIRLLDPSGNLIVKYNDIQTRGDGCFTTYSSLPEINVLDEYDWERRDQPHMHEKTGYQLCFNVRAVALDDPFDEGFDQGFEENYIIPETFDASGNNYLALDGSPLSSQEQNFINPSPGFKVTAVEICNSGGFGPRPEDFIPVSVAVREKGLRLERCITPRFMPLYDYDTSIHPSVDTVWGDGTDTNEDTCGAEELVRILNQKNATRHITLQSQEGGGVADSGKLVLRFGDCFSDVDEIQPGAFDAGFDQSSNKRWWSPSGAFNTENRRERIHRDEANFFNVDTITLKVLAKKEPGTRDYLLDVVGYSDDKLLNITSPSGGFLQNPSGICLNGQVIASTGEHPVTSGFYGDNADWTLAGAGLSERDDYFEASGNDHYKLTPYPMVTGTDFDWYEVPLEISDDVVRLGRSRDYSVSSLLEKIYLDIYPLPSGASVAYAELCVRYAPANGLNFFTQGGEKLGKAQDGRSEAALFPSTMGATDDILNAGSGYGPISEFSGLPHLYSSPETLKTNYARRFRGVNGVTRGPYDPDMFGFAFENPTMDYPFLSGYFKWDKFEGLTATVGAFDSVDIGDNLGTTRAFYNRNAVDLHHNDGWRYSSGTLFPGIDKGFTTTDYTSVGDPLYGKISDSFDRALRINMPNEGVSLAHLNAASGFAMFVRFSPDVNVSGVGFDQFQSGVICGQYDTDLDFALAYSGGYLCGLAQEIGGNVISILDTVPFNEYTYPLSVILTYNDHGSSGLKLYTDNESAESWDVLRASSAPFHKVDTPSSNDLYVGYSAGSGVGFSCFLSEFGISAWGSGDLYGSGTNIVESNPDRTYKQVTAEEFLENLRVKYFDPDEPYTNDRYKLWDRVNEDTYNEWGLGAFKHCQFGFAYDQWKLRPNREQIVFDITHHGSGYSESNDLPMPTLVDSGVSYHTQIENDFLRFHLSDVPDSFYSVNRRITKNLPCGYKFSEDALVVETVIDHSTGFGIAWTGCEEIAPSGPRMIVSLYTKKQEPYWTADEPNWGLVNRKTHYLMPSSCIEMLRSTFSYDDLCDETEAWALFPEEPRIKDFGERYFSDDVNDMFVQYDLVYPSGPAYQSRVAMHSSHVRMADANICAVSESGTLNLMTSGAFPADASLDLNIGGFPRDNSGVLPLKMNVPLPYSILNDTPDGFTLNVSGAFNQSANLNLFIPPQSGFAYFNLSISGELASGLSNSVNLAMPNTFARLDTSDDRDPITSLGGSGEFFGMPLTVFNSQVSIKPDGPVLTLNLFATSGDGVQSAVPLTAFNNFRDFTAGDASGDVTLNLRGGSKGVQRRLFGTMPLYINAPNILSESMPLFIQNIAERFSDNASMALVTANFSSNFGSSYGLWFNNNYGTGIELEDDYLASIPATNEIRGVDLTAYGSCTGDSPSKAIDKVLETDCTIWRDAFCNDGGIFRAKETYTNSGAINFSGGIGYSGNYYGIRKYDQLMPSVAYTTTLTIKTGDTEPIPVPPTLEEWEYGICGPEWNPSGCCTEDCDQDLAYSGVKLIADQEQLDILVASGRKEDDRFGSAVSVKGDLMAISAPRMTIPDYDVLSGVPIDSSGAGAVFLYRRGEDVPGKKAPWNLIEPVMLPSGFRKDYIQRVSENLLSFGDFVISGNKWQIGQEGREFGSSLDIAQSGDREVMVVGAPRAKWQREFTDITTSGIPTAGLVVADLFDYNVGQIQSVASVASRFNILWKYFSAPWKEGDVPNVPMPGDDVWYASISPKIIVLQLTYSNKDYPVVPTDQSSWFTHRYIPRLDDLELLEGIGSGLLSGSGDLANWIEAARPVVFNEMYSGVLGAFFSSFPSGANTIYSGIPAIMGMFKEETGSTAGALRYADASGNVVSLYDAFENFYHDYSVKSGVYDPITQTAQSGHLNTVVGQSENWSTTARDLLSDTFDSGRLSSTFTNDTLNRNFITSGVGQIWGDTHTELLEFQVPPASGGRVYIFENERGNFNCVQVIVSPNDESEFEESNDDIFGATYGKTYNDRFGHSVAISQNGEIVSVGSPWNHVSCRVYERDENQNQRVYDNVRSWCVSKGKTEAVDIYDQTVTTSGIETAKITTYDFLTSAERFEFRNDIRYWGSLPTPYIPSYTYGYGDIQYVGTRQFLPGTFAGTSRLGWSTAVNEEGDIVAFGAPTDSFNEFEDANIWGDDELSWASYVNAGAVRVFESRKYHPHSGIIEFGRFGNLDRSAHQEEREAGYYDQWDIIFGSGADGNADSQAIPWRRTDFSEIEIPEDVGLAFIMTPELDSASDEIIDNIKNWLALGDRNLVLVGNDPVWEENGLYEESNQIVNKVLEKLGSRMRIYPARNEEYALNGCINQADINDDKYNITRAKQPSRTTGSTIGRGNYYGNGFGDIRIHLERDGLEGYTEYQDCTEGKTCDGTPGPVVNVRHEMPLSHEGDLRAEWTEQCIKSTPRGCKIVSYKKNWPLQFNNYVPNCDSPPSPIFLRSGQEPVPVLTTAEHLPPSSWYLPATSGLQCDYTYIYETYYEVRQAGSTTAEFAEDHIDHVEFGIQEDIESDASGIFNSFTFEGDFVDPDAENGRDGLIQGIGRSFYPEHEERTETRIIYPDSILGLVESGRKTGGEFNNSRVYLMATQWSEDDASRGIDAATQNDDKNTEFYMNMVRRDGDCVQAPRGMHINGFTGRTSLENAYYLKDEEATDGHGLGDKLQVEFTPGGGGFTQNHETSEINELVDFVWVAHPSGRPSAQELSDLQSWLDLGGKKLIITYNSAAFSTRQEIASNVDYLCSGLNVESRPFFVPSVGEYWVTQDTIRSYNEYEGDQRINKLTDSVSGCDDGYTFTFPNYQEPTSLSGLHFSDDTENTVDDPSDQYGFNKRDFIPISGGGHYQPIIWWKSPITERYTVYPTNRYKIDGEAQIKFPAEAGSGYRIWVNWVSEKTSEKFNICGDFAGVSYTPSGEDGGSPDFGFGEIESPCGTPIDLSKTTALQPQQTYLDVRATSDEIVLDLTTSPWRSFIPEGDLIDGVLPATPRFLSASGAPLPINVETVITTTSGIKRRLVDVIEDCYYVVNPAQSGIVPGVSRPVSHLSELYCNPEGVDPECQHLGNEIIEDGPVIAAEEFENFSAFQAGRRRSKIIVISDSTMLQGQCPEYLADAIGGNQDFIRSLYPNSPDQQDDYDGLQYEDIYNDSTGEISVNGRNWFFSQKLRAPERGSAAKYNAVSGAAVSNIVAPLYGAGGAVGSLENYTSDEDYYDPATLNRPVELKGEQQRQRIEDFYDNDALGTHGMYPRFSGDFLNIFPPTYYNELLGEPTPITENRKDFITDAQIGGGLNDLMRINNTDYLDLDVYYSGCLGDLFGYSIDLSQNKLIVGTPFNGYYTPGAASGVSGIVQWHEIENDPSRLGMRVAEDGGAGAAFVFERTGSGENFIEEFLPWEFTQKIKPDELNVGMYDFSPSPISALEDQRGPHAITDPAFIVEHARRSDNFGISVGIDCDMAAIGAPNHDYNLVRYYKFAKDADPSGDDNTAFLRKDFNGEFDIMTVGYDDWADDAYRNAVASGVVNAFGETSGTMVLNNGAVYNYRNEMTDFQGRNKTWIYGEKMTPQGYKDRTITVWEDILGMPTLGTPASASGTETDRFGQAVSIDRAGRGDSDYVMVAGSPRHDWPTSGNHPTSGVTSAGAAYTFDAMLREQIPAIPNSGGWLEANVFSSPVDKLTTRVYQNVDGDSETYKVSGILFSNNQGEIFLEVSGFDPATKGFIAHRPYVEKVELQLFHPDVSSEVLNLIASGSQVPMSGDMNLVIVGPDSDIVYNTVNLYQFGTSGFSSGVVPLFTEAPSGANDSLNLNLTSTQTIGQLELRVRGY